MSLAFLMKYVSGQTTHNTHTHTFEWFVSNISNKASATAVTASRRSARRRRRRGGRDEPKNERKTCLHPLTTLCILFTHCPIEHQPRPPSRQRGVGAQVLRTLRHFSLLSGCSTCKNQENREEQQKKKSELTMQLVKFLDMHENGIYFCRWPSEHNAN